MSCDSGSSLIRPRPLECLHTMIMHSCRIMTHQVDYHRKGLHHIGQKLLLRMEIILYHYFYNYDNS